MSCFPPTAIRRRDPTFPVALFVVLTLLAGGCVPVAHNSVSSVGGEELGARLDRAPNPDRVAALAEEFAALGPDVSPAEAMLVADLAVHYSEQLAESYDMVRPVELHNVLVNLKLRRGGLCYQMAECMLAELRELPLRTLELRRGIAWPGDLWNEHNCVVVTAVGAPFHSGVVLDAWRNGGRLRWAPVRMDHYPWQPKPAPPSEMIVASRRRARGADPSADVEGQKRGSNPAPTEADADPSSSATVAGFGEPLPSGPVPTVTADNAAPLHDALPTDPQ